MKTRLLFLLPLVDGDGDTQFVDTQGICHTFCIRNQRHVYLTLREGNNNSLDCVKFHIAEGKTIYFPPAHFQLNFKNVNVQCLERQYRWM